MPGNRLTIGYFNTELLMEWSILPWNGALQAAKDNNINIISFHGGALKDSAENIIYDLNKDGAIDGLISWKGTISQYVTDDEFRSLFASYKIPVVNIESQLKGYPCVTYSGYEGMKMVVRHLMEDHGFRKIAYLGLVEKHQGYQVREKAYKDAMKEYGCGFENLIFPWNWWDMKNGRQYNVELENWLKHAYSNGLEAVIGSCDANAQWTIEHIAKIGLSVPYDISVAGYDGFDDSRLSIPSLTTLNPSWFELGQKSVETLLDLMAGEKVPDLIEVTPQLIKAESCGCKSRGLKLAAKHNLKGPKLYESRIDVINEIDRILSKDASADGIDFYDTLIKEAKNRNKGVFFKKMDLFMRKSMEKDNDLCKCLDILSVLRIAAERSFLTPRQKKNAESILNSAVYYAGNVFSRHQENIKIITVNQIKKERSFGLKLISNFNIDNIMNLLAEELPSFGINECYIALFENPSKYSFPDPCPEWSKLVLAFDEKGRMPLDENGLRFRSREIVPAAVKNNGNLKNYVVNSLLFNDVQIGYAVFDASNPSGTIYSTLANQISNSLQGTLLIDRINTHAEILERGIKNLSESIEVMTGNIESIKIHIHKQSESVEENASSIEEMKTSIANIADISRHAAEISNNLDSVAGESIVSIRGTINSIKEIKRKSAEIIEIINLLQEISDKTKLLAFNASIEAVHAGEHGKGFSLISQEIRKLSENTNSSLKSIGIEINHLIKSINLAADVSESIELNLDRIIDNSKDNSDISNRINEAMQEQDRGSEEMLNAVIELVRITSEIKSSINEQVTTVEEFSLAIKNLKETIK